MNEPETLSVNGHEIRVDLAGRSLLSVLRDDGAFTSVKDGCSPQGQCGCCTVLVDGQPRVSCVTPARRVAGRAVTTFEGLDPDVAREWADAFCATGASQCGFCTPGIVLRLEGLRQKTAPDEPDDDRIRRALSAHLCRCTGWQSIVEAALEHPTRTFDPIAAQRRASLEGRAEQRFGTEVVSGRGGFGDDAAPDDALVALRGADGEWVMGETLDEARAKAEKVQGRRTTMPADHPVELPEGSWDRTLRTSWVDPAYLETDAAWCAPGGSPSSPLANGGAFGGKVDTPVAQVARRLAAETGRPVRVLWSREDVAQHAAKRPPIAAGVRADGSGILRAVATAGLAERVRSVAPDLLVEAVEVPGPPTSCSLRGAGVVEAAVLLASFGDPPHEISLPDCGTASAAVGRSGSIAVRVDAGVALDEVVLRSYCLGAAHMAYSWVTSESLAVDEAGTVQDLTVRSLGVVPAAAMPHIDVEILPSDSAPVNVSDSVFAAVACAVWAARGFAPEWPTR